MVEIPYDLLNEAINAIEGLRDQQAMQDDWFMPTLERLKDARAKARFHMTRVDL